MCEHGRVSAGVLARRDLHEALAGPEEQCVGERAALQLVTTLPRHGSGVRGSEKAETGARGSFSVCASTAWRKA